MSRYVCVSNKGEIEKAALTLMGASTKDGDDSKIGFFGSGNKYAIAVLLRNNILFRIFSGLNEIVVTTQKISFGGQDYDQIVVDGEPTSLTTRMGPKWEVWFVLREFICNAIDEGGNSLDEEDEVCPAQGISKIYIEQTNEVADFMSRKGEFIVDKPYIDSADTKYGKISVFEHPAENKRLVMYRKTIRVVPEDEDRLSLLRYDVTNIDINESRIVSYDFMIRESIQEYLCRTDKEEIVKRVLSLKEDDEYIENDLGWSTYTNLSPAWRKVIGNKTIYPRKALQYVPFEDTVDNIVVSDRLAKKIAESFPDVRVFGHNKLKYIENENPSPEHAENLRKAIAECEAIGLRLSSEWKSKIGTILFAEDTMAICIPEEHVIVYEEKFMDNYEELVSTVYEETMHTLGYADGSRCFEQELVKRVIKLGRRAVKSEKVVETLREALS